MTKTLVFITGANVGLGYYAAQRMAASGTYHIFMGSRDLKKAEAALQSLTEDPSFKIDPSDIEPVQIDVTSDESIKAAVALVEAKYGYLDILMANAGIAQAQAAAKDGSGPSLRELYQSHYNTNVFGAAITVDMFLPLLRKSKADGGKRIAFTSSGLASLKWAAESETNFSAAHYPIYRSTKTALSMIMLYYYRLLKDDGFTVCGSDPGYCATNLNNHNGLKDPRDGAKVLIRAATDDSEKVNGKIVNEDEAEPW